MSKDGPQRPDVPTASDASGVPASTDELIIECKAAAQAANTRKAYRTGWNSWTRWAAENGHADIPATTEGTEKWLATLWDQGKKPTTLRAYLAAVANHLDSHPGPNPARDLQVRQLLSGLARKAAARGITPRQAAALRWQEIVRIIEVAYTPRCNQPGGRQETAEQAAQRAILDIAMICVAHDAALRCSELLSLTWADIELEAGSESPTVRIRSSKTDQNGQGTFVPISAYTSDVLASLKPFDAHPSDRVFQLSPSTVTRRFKAAARAAGIDSANITSHSPRVGMAQDLLAHGTDLPGIMQACRWNSPNMVALYTRRIAAQDSPAAQYLRTQHLPTLGDDA